MPLNYINFEKNFFDKKVLLKISSNFMKAYMQILSIESVIDETEDNIEFDKVISFFNETGIKEGIENSNVQKLLDNMNQSEIALVASGISPIQGEDGFVRFKKSPKNTFSLNEDDKGNINFKELEWFHTVVPEEIIAERFEPTKGEDGRDLKGNVVPAKIGRPAGFLYGKNIRESADGKFLVALKKGRLEFSGGKVQVNDVLQIDGNVDNETGNISFDGDIVVFGDIKSGFEVNCTGGLEVKGVIEPSDIKTGKDLVAKGGITGSEKHQIISEGNILCKFIENATLTSEGNIVTGFVVHSNIFCRGNLVANGKNGLIVGGKLAVKKEINANVIGSSMGTKTVIELGIDPKLTSKLEEYKEKNLEYEKSIKMMFPDIENGKALLQRGLLDNFKKIQFVKKIEEYNQVVGNMKITSEEIAKIEKEISVISSGVVSIRSILYSGTNISIGRFGKNFKEDEKGPCRIFVHKGAIYVNRT